MEKEPPKAYQRKSLREIYGEPLCELAMIGLEAAMIAVGRLASRQNQSFQGQPEAIHVEGVHLAGSLATHTALGRRVYGQEN